MHCTILIYYIPHMISVTWHTFQMCDIQNFVHQNHMYICAYYAHDFYTPRPITVIETNYTTPLKMIL